MATIKSLTPSETVQQLILVWLDANIDELNGEDSCYTLNELRNIINTVHTFIDVNQCVNFLANVRHEKACLIVSGSLGQTIMPLIHQIPQLMTIYIFCGEKSRHVQWVQKWSKIKGVFTEIIPICHELKQVIQQFNQDSIPISIVPTNREILTKHLNQLDQSFMYTQLLKEILLNIDFPKKCIKEFLVYCRAQYVNNDKELKIINKFERKYRECTPIWWYTSECFLHAMLNKSLRLMDVDIIIKMGFFVRDLHHHIEKLHREQFIQSNQVQSFLVYRGQGLSKKDFEKMIKAKGGLMSFNNFISSSKKQTIGLIFAHRALTDVNCIAVLFKMIINPAISSTPFALVDGVSFYQAEQEVLFSMHTIFRIGEIKQLEMNNDRLWEVELILTSDNDLQLNALTQRMREETEGKKGWYRLCHLLLKLGQFNKAEELYRILLNQTSDGSKKGYIYHQLGWIKSKLGHYTDAIELYEKSLMIDEKTLPVNHPDLATSYDNIGLVYEQMGDYNKALYYHQNALTIYRLTLPSDHPDLATSLSNTGLVFYKLHDYSKALLSHQEALAIYRKTLPENHHSLAASYNNIGLVYDQLDDYAKALWYHGKTLEIYQKTLPVDHPDLAVSHQNIGKALEKMCEYTKALSSYKKAINIFEKTLPSNHPNLAICYTNIALVYRNINEYSQALLFYEKALDINEKILASNHPDFITLYNNIGGIYCHMNEYSKAVSFHEKALEISQRTFSVYHPSVASMYNKLAKIYYKMSCFQEAQLYAERAVNIEKLTMHSNNSLTRSNLKTYCATLELVKNTS